MKEMEHIKVINNIEDILDYDIREYYKSILIKHLISEWRIEGGK